MSLVRFSNVFLEFGTQKILIDAEFSIEPGERVCLIGRNGAGKSTMLRLITGRQQADAGEVQHRKHLRISQLDQELPDRLDRTVKEVIQEGLAFQQSLIDQYHELLKQPNKRNMSEIEELQHQIEDSGGWNIEQQTEKIVTQLNLPLEQKLGELSGGWQRRVLLGRALVSQPELLLLDEPTNHLDISTIEWLESQILGFKGSVIFITHDRNFLQRLATRIVEIDRGRLVSWPGSFRNYLELKEKAIEEEDTRNALFDKKLAQEEEWIRRGVKARRTRNEGRVRALYALREEFGKRIKRAGKVRMHVETAEQSARKVIEARHISHGYNGRMLINDFSIRVMRGDRIGLIGNNGVGKSTLLKILLGQLTPGQGSLKLGVNIEVGFLDQIRQKLEPDKSVAYNVGDGRDYIRVNDREIHIIGYLKNFLFSPERAMTPVKVMSGGECNRILLAKLFTRPTNLLVLDEPTNDLDVEMLEVLEEQLMEYPGTLIIVSHDREFLDNVVTSVLVFEGDGKVQQYAGGYSDWLRRGRGLMQTDTPLAKPDSGKAAPAPKTPKPSQKLSYKYQRELEQIPNRIETLEKEIAQLHAQITAPDFHRQGYESQQPVLTALGEKQRALDEAMEQWIRLEAMAGQGD
ncbi:MAG TPA: ATP-binding cassette domain-containing protein [Gammaproteobacteria bacterium]|nr:ATP-binding cassette domain-containing protein [Gammaproteobacteria bacterium]